MSQRKDTRIHLVQELEQLPRTASLDQIIAEAKAGEFHDYKNQKYACGKVAVVDFLRREAVTHPDSNAARKLIELSQRVIQGEFDEVADREDIENMRKDLPPSLWPAFGLDRNLQ